MQSLEDWDTKCEDPEEDALLSSRHIPSSPYVISGVVMATQGYAHLQVKGLGFVRCRVRYTSLQTRAACSPSCEILHAEQTFQITLGVFLSVIHCITNLLHDVM